MTCQLSSNKKYLATHTSCGNISDTPIKYMEASHDRKYKESAFVMITCIDNYDMQVVETLSSIPEVKEIQHTYGNYDVVIKIETDTAESLRDAIESKIRTLDKIRATTTLISSPMLVF